ncbi:hypothetical protein C8J36_103562 [Rhizobium sp. PP-F2F-G48]|uniref:hypothetical protein n=1 Tax=Rhizobium sp. PP-F2F-G48 TaxID=2135651 RepID=UPI001043EE8A|nr:hypothetical protein [Rhizobium sp. PP-F2F-G48]TCM56190.1 hypothetical protein C8J36_103562 [Rhizobium sp. PP-F2F-G48]
MSETKQLMQSIAKTLDAILNGTEPMAVKSTGFVLLLFPLDQPEGARTNYVSNCDQADIIVALKEIVARFEGQPHQSGRA